VSDERRTNPRLMRREAVALQVRLPGPDGLGLGRVLNTQTLDISREGVRLVVDEPIGVEHLYDLCVDLEGHQRHFLLTCEVRWCKEGESGLYEAGVVILDGEGTDFDEWAAAFDGEGRELEAG